MMDETEDDLRQLNERISIEENSANRLFFEDRLASAFAFRRASGAVDSREMFLLSLKPDGNRIHDPDSVQITRIGRKRALVHGLVRINSDAYHNTRLFILDQDKRWKLLAWANERDEQLAAPHL